MEPGNVVAGRFEIERLAGRGGMGAVWRARDRVSGAPVALKVLLAVERDLDRFTREAKVLGELRHPGIVRLIHAGATPDGAPFLAMEWLEGEDLGARLDREPLSVGDSLAAAARVAAALAEAHGRGIVHRDVKPSNVFLVGGSPRDVRLVDFGIAHNRAASRVLTATGAVIGTLGYMAPEQVRGDRDVDGRADVFSLGCVLWECLAGRPAFPGENPVAVLARVLIEEVPDLREARPELDPGLVDLVARMVKRDRNARIATARDASLALDEAASTLRGPGPARSTASPAPMQSEQRIVSLVLVERPEASVELGATQTPEAAADERGRIQAVAEKFGGEARALTGGATVVTLAGSGTAGDLAVRAADCALALRDLAPDALVALSTGRTGSSAGSTGAIDRAVRLVASGPPGVVRVDEVTAPLLEGRFETATVGSVRVLLGRRRQEESCVRLVIGRPTPFVGRERELGLLASTVAESVDDPAARLVVVTAPPGAGKTRLRRELCERVARERPEVRQLSAAADSIGSGSALSVARALVLGAIKSCWREACVGASDLASYVRGRVGGPEAGRVAELLGELAGLPTPDPPTALLAGARNEPRIMNEQMQRAFEDWLGAETRAAPLLVTLEDLQWGDAASVAYLDAALRALSDRPLCVIAFARPEVRTIFPSLFARERTEEVRLGGLARRAAERLVRAVLVDGDPDRGGVSDRAVSNIVERADGNAFYLEELVRWFAERAAASAEATDLAVELPETVLVMLEARLERLDADARRVLRAASVLGGTFWTGAVVAQLGSRTGVDGALAGLVSEELVVATRTSRIPGEQELAFRHALLRDAAYAMATPEDRAAGHLRVAEWLESVGENDPLVLCDHLERAGALSEAIPHLLRAARAAIAGGDLADAITLSKKALALGPDPVIRGELVAVRAYAHGWSGEWHDVLALSAEGMELLPAGRVEWWLLAGGIVFGCAATGNIGPVAGVIQRVMQLEEEPEATGPCGFAMALLALGMLGAGHAQLARTFVERFERIAVLRGEADPAFAAWLRFARGLLAMYSSDSIALAISTSLEGRRLLDLAGDPVGTTVAPIYVGVALYEGGDMAGADRELKSASERSLERNIPYSHALGRAYLVRTLVALGRTSEALEVTASLETNVDLFVSTLARIGAVEAHLARAAAGDPGAAALALAGLDAAERCPVPAVMLGSALQACRARLALLSGEPAKALEAVKRGLEIGADAAYPSSRSHLLLARAEALRGLGDVAGARGAIREAAARIESAAVPLAEHGLEGAYRALAVHARTLELADQNDSQTKASG